MRRTWLAFALCFGLTWFVPGVKSGTAGAWQPLRSVSADVCWIRFAQARGAGRLDQALLWGERALELDPRRTGGWIFLASYLGLNRASHEHEPDAGRRSDWIDAAVELLRRGREVADDPAELFLREGLILFVHAQQEELGAPDTAPHFYRRAAVALEQAAELGHPEAAQLLEAARLGGG